MVATGLLFSMKKLAIVTLSLMIAVVTLPATVQAATPKGLQIYPLRSRPAQRPGDTSASVVNIKNNTSGPQQVELSVERFKVTNENYDYDFSPGEHTDWIRLADKSLTLASGEAKGVAYSLAVPIDASPGGYYFAVFASIKNSGGTSNFTEVKRVASLIYLEVSGKVVKKVNLIGVDTPWFTINRTINADLRLNNQGNSHHPARIKQYFENLINQESPAVQKEGLILPGTIRKLSSKLEVPRMPGIYHLAVEFTPPQGGTTQSIRQNIVYFPVWSWFVSAFLIYVIGSRLAKMERVKRHLRKRKH